MSGWSIANNGYFRIASSTGAWTSSGSIRKIRINGSVAASDPSITISGGSAVTEGTAAEFTITADSAPAANLTVNLTVADATGSDFVAAADEGSKTVTINATETTATYNVTTQADSTDEPNGTVTVTVASGTGYTVGTTSSATVTVNDDDTNNPATGAPTISGFAQVQQTLTAGTSGIMDTDGLTSPTYSYQWIRVDGSTETNITGATSSSYTLATADQGKTVKVKVTFQDDDSNSEELTSTATAAVAAAARSCTTGNAWCATLTVAQESGATAKAKGYCSGVSICSTAYGTLSDTSFTLDSTDYTVKSIRWGNAASNTQGNKLHLTLDQDFPAADLPSLTLKVTSHELALSDATRDNNKGTVANNYKWTRPNIANDAVGLQMTVELLQAASNNAPVFSATTLTRSIAENTAANTNVGAVIPAATDSDGDTLTYTMEGTDAASFTFDASTRQITTKTGVTYDHEAKDSYEVTIKADDSNGGTDTVDVTISVTDENEPPTAPDAPTVTGASSTSLSVSWTAPDTTGKPDITDYDVQYKLSTASSWTDHSFTSTDTSTTISSLTASTAYDVQVKATNDEDSSAWSASGSGSTAAADPAVPSMCPAGGHVLGFFDAQAVDKSTWVVGATSASFDFSTDQTVTFEVCDSAGTKVDHGPIIFSDSNRSTTISGLTANSNYWILWNVGAARSPWQYFGTKVSTNNAPAFANTTETRSIAENTAAGENVGAVIPAATDADAGDTLTYSMEGTDAGSFTFDASTRQITTKTGVTYDFETKSSYSVTIKADDGNGGTDTVDVTINLANVEEPPDAPGAPTVTAASATSLDVSWTAPSNTGAAAITDYDLRYYAGSTDPTDAADWIEEGETGGHTHSGTATTATITGLTASTAYRVQVRAAGDGESAWSSSGSATTSAHSAPTISTIKIASTPRHDGGNGTADTYIRRDTIAIDVTYNEAVTVTGGNANVKLRLDLGADNTSLNDGSRRVIRLASLRDNNTTLRFEYTVTSTDIDGDGIWVQTATTTNARVLFLAGGATIKATSSDIDANLDKSGLPTSGDSNHKVDGNIQTAIPPANTVPSFDDGDTKTLSIGENNADAATVGTVAATDSDGDTLTYSLTSSGTDHDSFTIDSSGNIKVATGVTLDHEAKASYSITAQVTDGEDSSGNTETTATIDDTIAVTIDVTDTNEVPEAPGAPTVTGASATSVSVSWTAPDTTGKPAINDYDVQYKASADANWTDHSFTGTDTSTTISSLTTGTTYNVQVKAKNAEGDSAWSATGSGVAQVPTNPTITISGGAAVTEGTAAQFTVTSNPAPAANLTVNLSVADATGSDFVASGDEGSKTVTISSGSTTATYNVTTQADTTDEPNGSVTVTVKTGTGYTVGTTSSANVTVNDDDDAVNNAPVFTSQPTTASVAENSADGTVVVTITATDADAADTLAYSLDSTADAVFNISSSGAITVAVDSGSALDHEATSSYTVTVTASDGTDTATHDVTISVSDVAEAPDAPAAPTLDPNSVLAIDVTWTAPDVTGKPAISDYDVQFKLGSATTWTDHDFEGTALTTAITGLTANTTYDVRVRATNDEGTSGWSPSGRGSTYFNSLPIGAVTIDGTATQGQTLTANTGSVSDPDGPFPLTFSYQWKRDGTDITGATSSTYTLVQADVGESITVKGSWTDAGNTPESVTSAGTSAVMNVNDAPTGSVTISGTATQGQTLTADASTVADPDGLGSFSYQWTRISTDSTSTAITGATSSTYVLVQDDVGSTITVTVSWTDGGNTGESLTSAATSAVANVNDAPTGAVTIDGTATQGGTLTANTSGVGDLDGLGAFSYQWTRGGTDITGATAATYVPVQADVGSTLTVTVSWTDDGGMAESLESAPTATVTDTNDPPTGSVTISGTATQGQTLTADASSVSDPDGPTTLIFSYQWERDDTDIAGATAETYVLVQDDVGETLTVTVSWTDDGGTTESLESAPTAAVANVNDAPTGAVTIDGTATQGGTLTANTSGVGDLDGLGPFSYQWTRGGTDITGATAATYVPVQADVGSTLTVTVSWTDDGGTAESLTSGPTATVIDANDPPTGSVTITGTATQGGTLTANTSTVGDPDGPATLSFSYQWTRGVTEISGATSSTYTLVQADVGSTITVTVSWTDGGGRAESLTSPATATVTDTNDAPTGAVTITGTATQGETLTADASTVADTDGLGPFSYQWTRDGADIAGATAATYELVQADVGATITVTVSWNDGGGTVESLSSAATAAVANVNDAPVFTNPPTTASVAENSAGGTAVVTITATDADNDTLTYSLDATSAAVFDIDASGAITVQPGATLARASTPSYAVVVTVTDGTEAVTHSLTITVTTVGGPPDPPPPSAPVTIPVGETTIVAGAHQVTVQRDPGTPEVRLALPGPVSGDLTVTVKPVTPDVPLGPGTFNLGPAAARTVVDVNVSAVPAAGLVLCLPVTPAVRQAAATQPLVLLHYVDGRWTEVPGSALDPTAARVCATVTAFSPFAVGYRLTALDRRTEVKRTVKRTLAAVARRALTSALDNIGARFAASAPASGLTLAGETMPFGGTVGTGGAWPACAADGFARHGHDGSFGLNRSGSSECAAGARSRSVGMEELFRTSSFSLALGAAEGPGTASAPLWSVWGRGDLGTFEGRPEPGMRYEGEQQTGWLGVDARAGAWVAGLAVSHGAGEADYSFDGGEEADERGRLETRLTTVYPYGRWTLSDGLELRGVLGAGAGEARHRLGDGPRDTSDLTMWMGSMGVRQALPALAGIDLAVRADASLARLETGDGPDYVDGLTADSWRLRGGLEGSRRFALDEESALTPFVEAAARRDGGDGLMGTGLEVAGGLRYTARRLQVEARGRWLAAHTEEGARESGVSLTVRTGPGADGRGLSLALSPSWGAGTGSAQAL